MRRAAGGRELGGRGLGGGAVAVEIATRWPSATNRRATPRPMPDAPPVTTATRLIGARRSSTGVELEVQLGEAAEDPRRLVVEAAVAGRAVVLLGEADVVHPVEDALEADAALDAGERAAGARVGAASEGDVGLRVRRGRCGTRPGTRTAAGRGWRRR